MRSWNKKIRKQKSLTLISKSNITHRENFPIFSFLDPFFFFFCGKCALRCTAAEGAEVIPAVPIFWIKDAFPTFFTHSQLSQIPADWDKIPQPKSSLGDLSMRFCCWNQLEMCPQGLHSHWLCFGIFPKCLIPN